MNYDIPEITRESIDAWVHDARPTGGFLRAVLENNLRESFARADLDNRIAMFDIVNYLYNECPGLCWGSPERVAEWPEDCVTLREVTERLNRRIHGKKSGADTAQP